MSSQNKESDGNMPSQVNSSFQNRQNKIELPTLSLPKGGGAIKGIEEKFQVNAVTGTSTFSIPLPISPSRNGFVPPVGLSYNSGNGNGSFGLGWQLAIASVARKTEKQIPQYKDSEESDIFILSGAEDLIPLLEKQDDGSWKRYSQLKLFKGQKYNVTRYRPRIEGGFSRIEKWTNALSGEAFWKTISGDNIHAYYGLTNESRLYNPKNSLQVFEWFICQMNDDKGNICLFNYKKEDFESLPKKLSEKNKINNCTQVYLKKITYGNKQPFYFGDNIPDESAFMFKLIFDYGEHDSNENVPIDIEAEKNTWLCRKDPFSSCRAGFEIRTYRRCSRVLMFHCFDELTPNNYLTKSLQLIYDDNLKLTGNNNSVTGFSFLISAKQNGHLFNINSNNYTTKYLPEVEINYQQHDWNTHLNNVTSENLLNSPVGLSDKTYLWIDLFNEGISGILTEKDNCLYYKHNLGNGDFTHAFPVTPKPLFSKLTQGLSIQELEGNGEKYLVQLKNEPKGFFKFNENDEWGPMKNFSLLPNFNTNNENIRAIDLNGDGRLDLLSTEENTFRWYASIGENGFEISQTVLKEIDEEKGPAIIFIDREQSIFLADMNGDGLTDIVRIKSGEICYWANIGYGKFSSKVNMDNAPIFDYVDTFNPSLLRLADIDGSGTIDLIYLGKNDFRVWMNLNGNEWSSQPQIINPFPHIDNLSDVAVFDFLGTGTACIVYSSPINQQPLQYIDIMGSKKPGLFNGYKNNCGKEVSIYYKPSTYFYLKDKQDGNPWITKLPFPVHCIASVKSEDKIRQTVFTNSYSYRHGYFDYIEKEFRGFARVEQIDTEDFDQFKLNDAKNVVDEPLHQPPVRSVSWIHTGAFFGYKKILHQCQDEYFQNKLFDEYQMPEPILGLDNYGDAVNFTADELREALRACKGLSLRSEVYANDNSGNSLVPYSASQAAYEIRLVQPKGDNKYASFQIIPSESISYGYERNPADPRISQSFILDVDELGQVKKSTSVVYPRVKRPINENAIPDKVWDEQNKMHIVYGEALFTNYISQDDVYRLPAGYESKSFEISGINQPLSFFFKKNDLKSFIAGTNEILFDEEFDNSPQKRLSAHNRGYFMKDDLSGPMPLGQISLLGIAEKSYTLAFTKKLVTKYYGTKVTDQMLTDAKYVHSEGDEHWWTQPGEVIYPANAKNKFYTPIGGRDVFGNESYVQFDQYNFLVEKTTDAINNFSTSLNDYRTLSATLITDPNLNRVTIETDELGMVIKSAVMGKEGAGEGDTLADPTSKMEYDLFNWKNNNKPNYVHAYAREKHGATNPRWQEAYTYSDGGGNVIMTKSQVNPGKAKQWNRITKQVDDFNANPRWIGNGRTIYNNKGNAVKKYDPYFSATFEYESEDALVETGISPIIYYDAIGRNIRTELPNGTFTKVVFDAWQSVTYDLNDTVKDSQWYINRGSPDPNSAEPIDPETRAAWLAAKHYNTPSIVFSDSIGKTIYAIADYGNGKTSFVYSESDLASRASKLYDQLNRNISEGYTNILGQSIYGKTAEKGERWIFTDVMGRLVKIWDNNTRELYSTFDKLHRPVSTFLKENGNEILFGYVVYGDLFDNATAIANNLKGRAYEMYDQAGNVSIKKIDFKGNALEVERRLTNGEQYKQIINWNILQNINNIPEIEALAEPFLEKEIFTAFSELDAINRPITVILPDASVIQPQYNEANCLSSLNIQLQGKGNSVNFLANQDYDAKGQRQYAKYGNGTITNYFYDPQTFRLINLITKKNEFDNDSQSIQNLNYTFDPIGNITQIRDDAQQTNFFNNAVVYPENKYEYNAINQLIKATGREFAGIGGNNLRNDTDLPFVTSLPYQNNIVAVRNYIENYQYDDCGNIKTLQHIATDASWTQRYQYEHDINPSINTNRLRATNLPGDANGVFSAIYLHNSYGNMTSMPHLSIPDSMQWNFMDQLDQVDLGGGGKAYYVYGSDGNRIRKIINRIGGKKLERIYLGAVEIYRESIGKAAPDLERYTLHIFDNVNRIAQIDTKTIDKNNSDPSNLLNENNIRYQYSNHLGSALLETDKNGSIISYEEYHPYGTSSYRISKSSSDLSLKRYRYSGKERDDETGFYYFGARYYAAWLGRWTSSDPAGFVSGFNQFVYCSNNPVMNKDATGYDDENVLTSSIQLITPAPASAFDQNNKAGYLADVNREQTMTYRAQTDLGNTIEITSRDRFSISDARWGLDTSIGQERWIAINPQLVSRADTSWTYVGNVSQPNPPPTSSTGLGAQAVTANPEGFTLEVPNNFDNGKIEAYRERITTDRGVGNRSAVPGERATPKGSDVTDGIRYRPDSEAMFDAAEGRIFPNGRPNGQQLDHTVELQHVIRGNATGGADTIRPQDFRPQSGSVNTSQGSSAMHTRRNAVANGAPEDVPAGGVARSSEMGRFTNSEGFRTGLRWGGFGLMWAGPFMTAYAAYNSDNELVRYGGGAVSATEFGAAGYYTYGRFMLNGATGAEAGVGAMAMASRIGMGAGGAGAVIFNGYQAYQDFSQGHTGWGIVNTVGAIAGGVMIAAALGFTAPVWGTVAAVVALGVGIAGLARWAFS